MKRYLLALMFLAIGLFYLLITVAFWVTVMALIGMVLWNWLRQDLLAATQAGILTNPISFLLAFKLAAFIYLTFVVPLWVAVRIGRTTSVPRSFNVPYQMRKRQVWPFQLPPANFE